ncbi:MAG TPA: TetR/AcrR family transcriptional regulator [Chloroflexi bacterium]|nr:TetR/AcrR family transcriptional regulator [Chloroflexota bacterium]
MSEELSRRERKKQETRQRLLEAALRLFRERGYNEATIEQIATVADVAKSTFFNYFEAKDAILPALIEWQLQELADALSPERSKLSSPIARIKKALCLIAEDPLSDPVIVRRLFAACRFTSDFHSLYTLTNLLADQVREAQAADEIRDDLDPLYVGGLIRALLFQQLVTWHYERRSESISDMLEDVVDLMLEGLAGPEWRKSS